MWIWLLLVCLAVAHSKRLDPSMIDPLMRRSPLDKNFMRFGRSSGFSYDDVSDKLLRPTRGKQDNFMRFGKADGNLEFESDKDNYMRFGRGKQDNFMRFGRGKQDNFMRFGRGKQDNFMRFGRGKQDNFMRFGRGKQDNFMRFGRGKENNFMRFGRDLEYPNIFLPDKVEASKKLNNDLSRNLRDKQGNFMRFGKEYLEDSENDIPIAMRSSISKNSGDFMRFRRGKQDNFMRFGKSEDEKVFLGDSEDNKINPEISVTAGEEFIRDVRSSDSNLLRFGRHPPNKDDNFMRFGRDQGNSGKSFQEDLIPPRLKRSVKLYSSEDDGALFLALPDDLDEEYSTPEQEEDFSIRKKRSIGFQPSTASPFREEDASLDFVSTKLRLNSPDENGFHSARLLSAGLPNVIVGPEFSLLPDLEPSAVPDRPGDHSFLRFG